MDLPSPIVSLFRSSSRSRRRVIALAITVLAAGCSGSEVGEGERFCAEAAEFQSFQLGVADALFDPVDTERFFSESVERMDSLVSIAPPTVRSDVEAVRDSYVRLDRALAEADYSVVFVDDRALDTSDTEESSDRINTFLDAACRSEGDPIPGFADDPFAPLVLSSEEISTLQDSVDDEQEMVAIVSAQLAEEFGLSEAEARCIVEGLDISFISRLAGGDPISADDTDRFVEVLATCDVTVGSLTE